MYGNYPDFIVPGGDTVSVLLGRGNGTFQAKTDFRIGSAPFMITTADFNCDGAVDFVTANYQSNDISLGMNAQGAPGAACGLGF